ncbi:hypothetical protein VTO42DRAFT_3123 [Malbranchea cinnamomea]
MKLSSASAIVALLFSGQAFSLPAPVPAPGAANDSLAPFISRSHMDVAEWWAIDADHDYRLTYLSAYAWTEDVKPPYHFISPQFYAGIWNPRADDPSINKTCSMTGQSYTTFLRQHKRYIGMGYRPRMIKAFSGNNHWSGLVKYVAIWVEDVDAGSVEWKAELGLSTDKFVELFNQYVKEGYRLTHVSGYEEVGLSDGTQPGSRSGLPYYTAIWEKRPHETDSAKRWEARIGLTSQQYQRAVTQKKAAGLRPVLVEGYTVGNVDYFAAIWEEAAEEGLVGWQARHDLTEERYEEVNKDLAAKGFVPTVVSLYGDGVSATAKYAGIWEKWN